MVPRGNGEAKGHVNKQAHENGGNLMGHASPNPILDSQQYVVEFEDGNDA